MLPNVVADRYSSVEMVSIFQPEQRVIVERRFWLAVLKAQMAAGLEVPNAPTVLADYEAAIGKIDLQSIRDREAHLKHDIPARLYEFNDLAGHQHLHKGMTSRDLTENVEMLINRQALTLVQHRTLCLLKILGEKATEYAGVCVAARTHNVVAQVTTMGKRFASQAEELLIAYEKLERFIENYPIRGIKGPVGTGVDQVELLNRDDAIGVIEASLAENYGATNVLDSVGQVYPRSLDFDMASVLFQLGSAPANLALLVRLMAGHELASEGFGDSQVGSSAMPHKMNSRTSERINGLYHVLGGYVDMCKSLSGSQWNEGDVSCSVVRRVAIPNLFLTLDGLMEQTFAVLRGFTVFQPVVEAELERYLPYLSTTRLLVWAVQNEVGRDTAHEIIKKHAIDSALASRRGEEAEGLVQRLARDETFPGGLSDLEKVVGSTLDNLGASAAQVAAVANRIADTIARSGLNADYQGAEIL